MWSVLAVAVDLIHAALMVAWVASLPLLFLHRWPSWTRAAAVYCTVFIVLSQGSQLVLGECFFTTLARWCWEHAAAPASGEWFTVRAARAVFGLSPSHHAVTRAFEVLALAASCGVLSSFVRARRFRASPCP